MESNYRIVQGNDFKFSLHVYRVNNTSVVLDEVPDGAVLEDLTQASNVFITVAVPTGAKFVLPCEIDGNVVTCEVPVLIQRISSYHALLDYDLPDSRYENNKRHCRGFYNDVFQIVKTEAEANVTANIGLTVSINAVIKAGLDGQSAYEIWKAEMNNNSLTVAEFLAYLQKPATDAVAAGELTLEQYVIAAQTAQTASEQAKLAAQSKAVEAFNSAGAAAASEANALDYKNAAALSETKAKISEDNAKLSETRAGTSEVNSKASETNAAESELKAGTSELNAKTSEEAALLSEQKAKESEDAAKLSETKAAESESKSKTSETNAADSEQKAGASELAAKTSQDAALLSEQAAKESQDAAKLSEQAAKASEIASAASSKASSVYNVTAAIPLAAGSFYTASTARAAVPTLNRVLGAVITYATANNVWYTEKYIGTDVANWTTSANWERVPDNSQLIQISADLNQTQASIISPETPVENNEKIDYLETKVNNLEKQLFSILAKNKGVENVEPRISSDSKKEESVVLSSFGEFTTPATNASVRKPMFVIVEDDSIDRHYESRNAESSCPEVYPGGYFSRLHPVLSACGVKGCLAYIGSGLGFSSSTPALTQKGYMHLLLHEKYGWEMLNHSLHHKMYFAYEFESIDAANSAGFNTSKTEIYIPSTKKNYIYNAITSVWDLTDEDQIEPFIKSPSTGLLLYDNPTFNMERQYRWNQLMGEKFGLGAVRNFIFPGETDSYIKRQFIKKTHNIIQGYSGFNVGTGSRIIPPLSSLLPRYILANPYPSSQYGEGYYNAWVNRQLTTWKTDVDYAIKEGASILYNIHSFRPMWENYNPSETGYNPTWIIPTGTYVEANYDMPNSNTGLTSWSQWYPCPNTRLRDLYDLIKYIQSKGYEVVTLQEYYSRMCNLVSVGEFTNNGRSQVFEAYKYPHYVVGVDGRSSYYNK